MPHHSLVIRSSHSARRPKPRPNTPAATTPPARPCPREAAPTASHTRPLQPIATSAAHLAETTIKSTQAAAPPSAPVASLACTTRSSADTTLASHQSSVAARQCPWAYPSTHVACPPAFPTLPANTPGRAQANPAGHLARNSSVAAPYKCNHCIATSRAPAPIHPSPLHAAPAPAAPPGSHSCGCTPSHHPTSHTASRAGPAQTRPTNHETPAQATFAWQSTAATQQTTDHHRATHHPRAPTRPARTQSASPASRIASANSPRATPHHCCARPPHHPPRDKTRTPPRNHHASHQAPIATKP